MADGWGGTQEKPGVAMVVVEGWRFLPHSYALVNQHQLAAMLRRGGIDLFHRDLAYLDRRWKPSTGMLTPEDEGRVRALTAPPEGACPDALLRIGVPYDFAPHDMATRTFTFGTCEFGVAMPMAIRDGRSLKDSIAGNSTGIVTPSKWSADGFVRSGAPRERVHVVPHGVDVGVFAPGDAATRHGVRRSLGVSDDAFVFLNIGAMTDNKGLVHLFHAFAEVARKNPRAMLLLKGIDALYPSSEFLRNTVRKLPEADAALVMQRTRCMVDALTNQQMARLYAAADAYVCPYLAEGFNLPALEAIACGVPVLCTRGGPTDDFTIDDVAIRIASQQKPHEKSGGFVLVPSEEHLRQSMERVIADDELRRRAREAGPALVRGRYTWDRVVDDLLKVLLDSPA